MLVGKMIDQRNELMDVSGLTLLEEMLHSDGDIGEESLLQADDHPMEVLPYYRMKDLVVIGGVQGSQEDLKGFGVACLAPTLLDGQLGVESFAGAARGRRREFEAIEIICF